MASSSSRPLLAATASGRRHGSRRVRAAGGLCVALTLAALVGLGWGCLGRQPGSGPAASPTAAATPRAPTRSTDAGCDPDAGDAGRLCRIPSCDELMPDAAPEDEPEPDCSELLAE